MSSGDTTAGWQADGPSDGNGSPRNLTGQLIGDDFQVERLLGRGGMGEVYLARQLSLNRPVALKVLKAELASNPTYLGRFEVEATAVARLNHPNIVQVYTLGRHGDLRFIALEYVHGTNLREYITRKGALELPLAYAIMRQTCQAMAVAGELGLIHRDIKPENLMMTRRGQVKVADFGLCREQGDDALHLTQEGVTLGTPMYMSPEQVRGHALDHRSDLYSMGVTFYHLLAGAPPFRADSAVAMALKHLQESPIDLSVHRPDLPPELCRLVMTLMSKKREDRPQSAREVDRELARLRGIIAASQAPPILPEATAAEEPTPPPDERPRHRFPPAVSRAREAMAGATLSGRALTGLAGVGLLAGAAFGWSGRPPDLLNGGPPSGPAALWIAPSWASIPRQATARDQLRYAQLVARPGSRRAALLAVPGHFPADPDTAALAYTHLARLLFDRLDGEALVGLAEAIEAGPSASDDVRMRTLAAVCRAAAAAVADDPAAPLQVLTALPPGPSPIEPGQAELALEVVEWAGSVPGAEAQEAQRSALRRDLEQALRVARIDPNERPEPDRRGPTGLP